MRVSNPTSDMNYRQTSRGLEISRSPVRIKFQRKCGTIVEFDRRGEKCTCSTCLSK